MNYILIDGKWIPQKGKQKTPSLPYKTSYQIPTKTIGFQKKQRF